VNESAPDYLLQPRPANVQAIALDDDGGRVAVITGTGEMLVTDSDGSGHLSLLSREPGALASVALSRNGKLMAAGNVRGQVKLWDVNARKEIRTLSTGDDHTAVASLAVSDDGQLLAGGTQDPFNYNSAIPGLVIVWEVDGGTRRTYRGHSNGVSSVSFAPDSHVLVSGSADHTAKIWDVSTDQGVLVLRKPEQKRLFAVAVSGDGTTVVTGSEGASTGSPGDVDVWDVQSRKRSRTLRGHSSDVSAVVLDTNGTILSGSDDGTVLVWAANAETPRAVLKTDPAFPVYAIAIDPTRRQVAIGGGRYGSGSMIQMFDLETLGPIRLIRGLTQPARSLAVSKTGDWLAVGAGSENPTSKRTLELLKLPSADDSGAVSSFSVAIRSLAFSPSGDALAVGWADRDKPGDISVWELNPLRERGRLRGHRQMVTSLAFTADGRALISSSGAGLTHYAGEIKIWDMASMQERATIAQLSKPILAIALSSNGRTLAGVTGDQDVLIWQASSKAPRTRQ
jgi:WD40 repeat protein